MEWIFVECPKSGKKYGILEILEFCHLCAIMRDILYNQVFSMKLFLLNWVWHVAYFCCPLSLYLPWDWVELLELCSNLCGRMGELVANCEAVKVLVFSVPVLLAVIPLRPGCCNRGYQIFYHSLFESTSFDFCLIQNNDFKHCATKIKMDSQPQESLFSYRVPSYAKSGIKQ